MIGRTLGPYRLIEAIGQGGMGVVYRAVDTRLGRDVAIKLLPPAGGAAREDAAAAAERVARFRREAQAVSALNHPNIVTLHDVGRDGDDEYLVMEYVPGRTVAALVAAGALPLARAVTIAQRVADALAAAHAAGVVHRDIKPQNVIVGDDGRVKVLDLGLARIAADANGADAKTIAAGITLPGAQPGTPAYMAPEQVEGRNADARSDVYATGVLLYEMLAGARPFRETSYATMVHAIVYEEPAPLVSRRGDVPRPLARVVEKCLRKDPAERYANGGELRAALEPVAHALEGGDAGAGAGDTVGGLLEDAAAGLRRHRPRMIRAAVGLVLLAAIVVVTNVPSLRDSILPGAAPSPFTLYKMGLTDLGLYYEPGRLDRATASFQRAVDADPGYAPGYVGLAEADWRRYRENKDEAILRRAQGYAAHAVEVDSQLARAHVAVGLAAVEAKDYAGARGAFDRALLLDPTNAQAWRGLAAIAGAEGRPQAAESLATQAIALAPGDWELWGQRGTFRFVAGSYDSALADYTRSAELSPDNPFVHRNLGGVHHMLGRFADAAASLQRSIEIRPDPVVYSNLGTIYFFQGLYPQAVAAFEKSVELGPNHATIWRNLGDSYRQVKGREKDAAQAYLRAAQLLREERKKEPDDPVLAAELALCLARRGDTAEARALADGIPAEGRALPEVAYALVLAHEAMGDRAAALAALSTALAAGHPVDEVKEDPELVDLRKDRAYHRILAAHP